MREADHVDEEDGDQAAVLGALVRGFQDGQLLGRLTSSSSATEIADAIRGVVGGA
jgi:hypothetical protein